MLNPELIYVHKTEKTRFILGYEICSTHRVSDWQLFFVVFGREYKELKSKVLYTCGITIILKGLLCLRPNEIEC